MSAMKPTLSSDSRSRPRLMCSVIRGCSSIFDLRNSSHVAACAGCQAHFHAAATLDNALRRDAARETVSVPDDFERRIVQAVRQSQRNPAAHRTHAWRGGWALGGVAAAMLAVFVVFLGRHPDTPDGVPNPNPAATTADATVIIAGVESLSDQLVDSVIPSAGQFAATNPLQQEMGFVYSDVRSALDFLALNFLPTTTSRPAPRARTI